MILLVSLGCPSQKSVLEVIIDGRSIGKDRLYTREKIIFQIVVGNDCDLCYELTQELCCGSISPSCSFMIIVIKHLKYF